jgi:hypothetical protein
MRINRLSPGLPNGPELSTFNVNRMNTGVNIEDRLWDYIDGLSSPDEKTTIESLIAANLEWQRKYKELLEVHHLMSASELEAPSLRFTKNVMEEIARHQVAPATKTYINKNVIRGVGAFFLCLIAGLLVYFFRLFKWNSAVGSGSSRSLPDIHLNLNKVDYDKFSSSLPVTLFMLVTVVLSFILLDMYLQRRKREQAS